MTSGLLGEEGEAAAFDFLEKRGFQLLQRNFRCRLGEIDGIGRHQGFMVFVEVKTRLSSACGLPFESVHVHKQRRIKKIAQYFLLTRFGTVDINVRFDVISVMIEHGMPAITWLPHAFE